VLLTDPAEIRLLDVWRAVEPETELFAMHRGGPNPKCAVGQEMCRVLADVYSGIERGMDELLDRTSIAAIVAMITERMESHEAMTAGSADKGRH
jgi:DNA-binding IscR family transcriptional regulator